MTYERINPGIGQSWPKRRAAAEEWNRKNFSAPSEPLNRDGADGRKAIERDARLTPEQRQYVRAYVASRTKPTGRKRPHRSRRLLTAPIHARRKRVTAAGARRVARNDRFRPVVKAGE